MGSEEGQKTIRWIVFPTNALALLVQTELKLDPHSGITVVFRSKRGDRLKILVWDGTGLVLVYKVLEQGSFAWPKVQDGTMRLSRAQFAALFEGLAPLLSYELSSSCVKLEQLPGTAFMPGSGGGRTVPLLVVVGRRRVRSPPSFLAT